MLHYEASWLQCTCNSPVLLLAAASTFGDRNFEYREAAWQVSARNSSS